MCKFYSDIFFSKTNLAAELSILFYHIACMNMLSDKIK